jgi:hypothetical protein
MQVLAFLLFLFSFALNAAQFDVNQSKKIVSQYIELIQSSKKIDNKMVQSLLSAEFVSSLGGIEQFVKQVNKFNKDQAKSTTPVKITPLESLDQINGLVKVESESDIILYRVILRNGQYLIDGTLEDPN